MIKCAKAEQASIAKLKWRPKASAQYKEWLINLNKKPKHDEGKLNENFI